MHQLAKKISLLWQRFIFTVFGICIMFSLGGCGQNWGWYVVNPTTPAGQQNLKFLIDGLYYTIALSLTAICISIIVGLLIALPGLSAQRAPRSINRVYVELVRSVPLLVLILWVYLIRLRDVKMLFLLSTNPAGFKGKSLLKSIGNLNLDFQFSKQNSTCVNSLEADSP